MTLRFTERAYRDLEGIRLQVGVDDPLAATRILGSLGQVFLKLRVLPKLGRPTDAPNIRCLTIPRYPYRVFCRVERDAIEIISVFTIWFSIRRMSPQLT